MSEESDNDDTDCKKCRTKNLEKHIRNYDSLKVSTGLQCRAV